MPKLQEKPTMWLATPTRSSKVKGTYTGMSKIKSHFPRVANGVEQFISASQGNTM